MSEGAVDAGSILVTGATGRLGRAVLARALLSHRAARVIALSRDERKQAALRRALASEFDGAHLSRLRFFLGDVRDRTRLELAFRGVDLIIHAAALNDVAAAEYNPSESIATNILGAERHLGEPVQQRQARDRNLDARRLRASELKRGNPPSGGEELRGGEQSFRRLGYALLGAASSDLLGHPDSSRSGHALSFWRRRRR